MLVSNLDSPPSPNRTKRLPPFSMYCFSASNYTNTTNCYSKVEQKNIHGRGVDIFLTPHFMSIYQNVHSYSWHCWYDYQLSKARQKFCGKVFITLLSKATYFVSIEQQYQQPGWCITCRVLYNFTHFAANDIKNWQVATGNRARLPVTQII